MEKKTNRKIVRTKCAITTKVEGQSGLNAHNAAFNLYR